MNSETTGEAAAAGLFGLLDVVVKFAPGAWGQVSEHGTRLVMSDSLLGTFNGVFTSELEVDVETVAALAKEMAKEMIGVELPWCVQTRAEPTPELLKVAAEHGLIIHHRSPLMVRDAGPVRPHRPDPDGPVVRRITGVEDQMYVDLLAQGFETSPEIFGELMSAPVLDAPGVSAYLVEHGGEPVATGFGILAAGLVGVYNIATLPQFRTRGYGRLVTEAILRDGFGAGATGAYLFTSELGQPLYRSLGFEVVETWTYLMAE